MKKELQYFWIGKSYGGCQNWFSDPMMKLGGCAAAAACDSCIYFDQFRKDLHKDGITFSTCPDRSRNRGDYVAFSKVMKPYLHPRMGGVDRLELYMDGFGAYLRDRRIDTISMKGFSGENACESAKQKVREQIDGGFPIPMLMLRHRDRIFRDYVWHWFLLIGYEDAVDTFQVKAVTYGSARWLNFDRLWDTGEEPKGGLILYAKNG